MKDLISVIVPIYNVENYLVECLNSICSQTYSNLEIILVDDGSTDSSGRIADEYADGDCRIQVFHRENGGLSVARNKGVKVASGEYLAFVDSDDVIADSFVQTLYDMILEKKVLIAQCGLLRFVDQAPQKPGPKEAFRMYSGIEMQLQLYNHAVEVEAVVACNKLYHKRLFQEIQFPEGRYHEDEGSTYLLYDLAQKVAVTRQPLYYYRERKGSIVNSKNVKRFWDIKDLVWERLQFYERKEDKVYERLYQLTYKRYYYELFLCYQESFDKEIDREMKQCVKKLLRFPYITLDSKIWLIQNEWKRRLQQKRR